MHLRTSSGSPNQTSQARSVPSQVSDRRSWSGSVVMDMAMTAHLGPHLQVAEQRLRRAAALGVGDPASPGRHLPYLGISLPASMTVPCLFCDNSAIWSSTRRPARPFREQPQ